MNAISRQRVVVLQSPLYQYRVTFLELLRQQLADAGVQLDVVYSAPTEVIAGRGDVVDLPWAYHVRQRTVRLGPYELAWQSCLGIIRDADLVIVEQATRRLLNYVVLAQQAWGGPRVALWGHGRNFQATSAIQTAAEAVKRVVSRQSQWFFAYNDLSAEVLIQSGYPPDRITPVGNSIDTLSLRAARDRVTDADRRALRVHLGLRGQHIGIYCGAMYAEKRLGFLVEAAREIRSQVPDFELVCVGSGVDRYVIDRAAEEHDWIHSVGPQFGIDLARHFALARVFLLPGLVGLAVLDSFVFEVPLVTTSEAFHSPEITYLEDGVNGIVVSGDGSGGHYADAVIGVLTDDALHRRLVNECRQKVKGYSAEAMAEHFAEGVLRALKRDRRGIARLAAG